jgi:formamidopyrimidine-DNA glycosylase
LESASCTLTQFSERLRQGNHTLKRALTDPTLFSGIGNAYSDEILHAARRGTPVQRIRYADNETHYCARCRPMRRSATMRASSSVEVGP